MKISEIQVSYSTNKLNKIKISNTEDLYSVVLKNWNLNTIELFEEAKIILLNNNNSILGIYNLSKGGVSSTIIDIRLILSIALKTNSSAIILIHNHPSGNLNPSKNDLEITKTTKEACNLLNIKLLDHLIVSKNGYYSFLKEGILTK
ncbi:JAB domain-containing protein [Moheibacter stercoris]|uniref:DNA repair protein RadC n=1 Tax=Moheibacter stercoris TaxID=1628251 RepID=A0ABV2LSB9_9FLAO